MLLGKEFWLIRCLKPPKKKAQTCIKTGGPIWVPGSSLHGLPSRNLQRFLPSREFGWIPGIPTKTHGLTNFALDPFGESCDLGGTIVGGDREGFSGIFCGGEFLGSRLSIMDVEEKNYIGSHAAIPRFAFALLENV